MKTVIAAALLLGAISPVLQAEENWLEHPAELTAPNTIKVLLERDVATALLEVKGPYHIFNPHNGRRETSGLLGKRFMIHELEEGLKWGEKFVDTHQIEIRPRSPETKIFVNGIQYSGSIFVYGCAEKIHIVNEVEIEDYVKAILSPEQTSLEPEVLSALAILARTNAHFQAEKNQSKEILWHVAATDVGYQGSALMIPNSPIDRAVETTRNLILVHPSDGKTSAFAATWTENSAGKTASYQAIYRRDGHAPDLGVDAPHAKLARNEHQWKCHLSKKALAQLLDVQKITSIKTFIDPQSNKVYAVRVDDGSQTLDIDFFTFQKTVGANRIQSNDFNVSQQEDGFHFTGFGKGHGVGLCLYSANALAQNGYNAVKILSKFFPETYLQNLGVDLKEQH